ncbi:MAG: aspartate--tRNA ligase, partial [Patescibacteria group bacterium]
MKTYIADAVGQVGQAVTLMGWVHVKRDMGKISFIDLRDSTGIVQVVLVPGELGDNAEVVKELKPEYVVSITGVIQARNAKSINPDSPTGTIEILAKQVTIINAAAVPPFEINTEEHQANEALRLKYRFLDLRHERMAKNITLRHNVISFIRQYLSSRHFREIETPYLTKSTPEGARDFVVPSRNYPGKFYALPQSPQQYKQMLMVAGIERYFQIVRCFRDEDQRGDRQAEFTQLDFEMSFVTQEDILQMHEAMLIELVKTVTPTKRIQQVPFPRLTFAEAMTKYNSDKPDLREDKNDPNLLALCWVVDFPMFEYKEGDKRWGAVHHPFTAIQNESLPHLGDRSKMGKMLAYQYDLALNGSEIGGGSIRTHDPAILAKVFEVLGHTPEEIQAKFGHLLEAFKYGVPPHGGIAWGLDRFLMIL